MIGFAEDCYQSWCLLDTAVICAWASFSRFVRYSGLLLLLLCEDHTSLPTPCPETSGISSGLKTGRDGHRKHDLDDHRFQCFTAWYHPRQLDLSE